MKCPHCNHEHPDDFMFCPATGKELKKACKNKDCSYIGEHIWPLEKETCPCCGQPFGNSYNGHEFVDLGLSVKWATCNIGAFTPEVCGDCFAWGETEPKETYESLNYKFRVPKHSAMAKYNFSPSSLYADNKFILEPKDDAASVKWGIRKKREGWRIPTKEEWQELFDNCYIENAKINGIQGYKVYGKRTGFREKWIFFPTKYYWSSSLADDYYRKAFAAVISFSGGYLTNEARHYGYPIRPVLSFHDTNL